jgi:hypothetical protein
MRKNDVPVGNTIFGFDSATYRKIGIFRSLAYDTVVVSDGHPWFSVFDNRRILHAVFHVFLRFFETQQRIFRGRESICC